MLRISKYKENKFGQKQNLVKNDNIFYLKRCGETLVADTLEELKVFQNVSYSKENKIIFGQGADFKDIEKGLEEARKYCPSNIQNTSKKDNEKLFFDYIQINNFDTYLKTFFCSLLYNGSKFETSEWILPETGYNNKHTVTVGDLKLKFLKKSHAKNAKTLLDSVYIALSKKTGYQSFFTNQNYLPL